MCDRLYHLGLCKCILWCLHNAKLPNDAKSILKMHTCKNELVATKSFLVDSDRWGSNPKSSKHNYSPSVSNCVVIELNSCEQVVWQWCWWEGELFRDNSLGFLVTYRRLEDLMGSKQCSGSRMLLTLPPCCPVHGLQSIVPLYCSFVQGIPLLDCELLRGPLVYSLQHSCCLPHCEYITALKCVLNE